jgi:hypothetical protein
MLLKCLLGDVCSTFVPKAHTPFQWYGLRKEADKRLSMLQKGLRPLGVDFRPESYKWSVVQVPLPTIFPPPSVIQHAP